MHHRVTVRRFAIAALTIGALIASGAAAADGPAGHEKERAAAAREGWPDTPVGIVAGDWVDAFARGEKAMRAFLETHVSKEAMAERSMTERLRSYRGLRERMGDLVLSSVEASKPHELTVILLAEDASRHRFQFTVDEEAPHALLKVAILQHAGGRGGHGHDSR